MREAIKEAAGGRVDIVLEMVGGRTFDASIKALAPFGRLVSYGMASRELPEPVDPVALNRHSTGVLGFWLAHCFTTPGMFAEPMEELLDLVAAGELRTVVGGTYPLGEARRAHEDLRARRTFGKLVLDPNA
jgi:NADPH2:quinone reductase